MPGGGRARPRPHFNPRTREGCDPEHEMSYAEAFGISIHAPVKGATRTPAGTDYGDRHFNPRTREGCD